VIARVVVVGFREGQTLFSLIGRSQGLTREVVIRSEGQPFVFEMCEHLAGKIFNAAYEETSRLRQQTTEFQTHQAVLRRVDSPAASVSLRSPVCEPLTTGVNAIDGLVTCGKG